jgi:heme exporter protein C
MTMQDHALRIARGGRVITMLALLGLVGVYVRALRFTPIEASQGPAQKIFYVHVPAAWAALLSISVCGLLSIAYLWLKDRRIDLAAAASAEVGVAFGVVMLTTGPLWGKPIWGTWWAWDARLTSTLFLFLLFVGYLVLRGVLTDPGVRGRFSAVIGIMGLVLVPFIHLTVYLFRTMHPVPIVLKPSTPSLPGVMLVTLLSSVGVFTLLYVGFVMQRYALGLLRELREEELAGAAA